MKTYREILEEFKKGNISFIEAVREAKEISSEESLKKFVAILLTLSMSISGISLLSSCSSDKSDDLTTTSTTASYKVEYAEYKIKSGDILSDIAYRFNTTVKKLMEVNNISDPNTIKAGDIILVPIIMDIETTYSEYTVKKNDKLINIAKVFHTTVDEILALNPDVQSPSLIKAGQVIKVPTSKKNYEGTQIYLVERNDSIYRICNKFDMDTNDFLNLNNLSINSILQPGDAVLVKSDAPIYETHTVSKGETIESIANRYQVTVEDIILLNFITDGIETGMTIQIPSKAVGSDSFEQVLNENGYSEDINTDGSRKINVNNWNKKLESKGYVTGIDISDHNKYDDMETLYEKNPEIDFVMVRSYNFWRDDNIDETFEKNVKIAIDSGKAVGTYWWPTCKDMASTKKEVKMLLNTLKKLESEGYYMTMPIAIDIETGKGENGRPIDSEPLAKELRREDPEALACLKYVINTLKKHGYYVMYYSSDTFITELKNQYYNHPDSTLNSKDGIWGLDAWVAKYYTTARSISISDPNVVVQVPRYNKTSHMRQYALSGRLKGSNTNFDLNRAYINYPELLAKKGLNHLDEVDFEEVMTLN